MLKLANRGVGLASLLLSMWLISDYDLYSVVFVQATMKGGLDLFSTILWHELSLNWWRVLGIALSLVLIFYFKIDEREAKK